MDAKEALQYVYCVTLSADQGNGVGKEQVEIAWDLTRRIIVLANGGPSWEELVGGIRAEGGRFVSRIGVIMNLMVTVISLSLESSNKVRHSCTCSIHKSSVIKSSSAPLVMPKKTTDSMKQLSCTTLRRTTLRSSHASLRRWVIPLALQAQMRRRGTSRRLLLRF